MLRRKAFDSLMEWKNRDDHKCLFVKDQRQVGKTYLIDYFAKNNYEQYVYVNLSSNHDIHAVFENDLNVDRIVNGLRLFFRDADFDSDSILLFFDEIQDRPRARESLKEFTIDGRYDVIASGSLLRVTDSRLDGGRVSGRDPPLLPIGYEETVVMTSMDFEEFLWAVDFPTDVIETVKLKLADGEEIGEPVLGAMFGRFRDFMAVRGMSESVDSFAKSGDYTASSKILGEIVSKCINDINRYNTGINTVKTAECFESIPSQLSYGNGKFTYSRINDGDGSRKSAEKYMENLLWIKMAGYGNFCYAVRAPVPILAGQVIRGSFKVYMSDTGILVNMYGPDAQKAVVIGDSRFNQGAVMENVVAECLMKSGFPPLYYRKTNGNYKMELDFVLEKDMAVTVLEVKFGRTGNSPSLGKVGKVFDIHRRIVLEDSDVRRTEDGVEHYPLFAAAFMDCILRHGGRGCAVEPRATVRFVRVHLRTRNSAIPNPLFPSQRYSDIVSMSIISALFPMGRAA